MARRREMAVREDDTTKTPTIYMALDLGRRRWTVGVLLPGDRDARLFQIAGGDREALSELIRRWRQTLGDPGVRVVSCFEVGVTGSGYIGGCETRISTIECRTRRASRRRGVGDE